MIINYLINILARKSISKRVYRTLVLISVFHRYMISERQELSYFWHRNIDTQWQV